MHSLLVLYFTRTILVSENSGQIKKATMEFWCWPDSALRGCTAEDVGITGTERGPVQIPLCSLTTHLTHDDGIKTWQQDKTITGFKGDEYRLEMVARHRCNLTRKKTRTFRSLLGIVVVEPI